MKEGENHIWFHQCCWLQLTLIRSTKCFWLKNSETQPILSSKPSAYKRLLLLKHQEDSLCSRKAPSCLLVAKTMTLRVKPTQLMLMSKGKEDEFKSGRLLIFYHIPNQLFSLEELYKSRLCTWASTRGGGQNGRSPWTLGLRSKIFYKTWSQQLKSDWFNSCNDSLFAGMTHTAQEPGSLFWCHAVINLQFTHVRSFADRCKTFYRIVLLLIFMRNETMATNLQRFTSSYSNGRFVG